MTVHAGRDIRAFAKCIRVLGVRGGLQWTMNRARKRFEIFPSATFCIRPRGLSRPVEMRGNDSSDADVFRQIFIVEEYKALLGVQYFFIIDLGANIGLSSAWFLSRFPQATILAVEPDPDNYSICCKNLAIFGRRARVLLGAAWSKRTKLFLSRGSFGDGREWARQVVERTGRDGDGTVEGWDVRSLIELSAPNHVDLLKIDVERGELEIFAADCENWLPFVRTICIELHGRDCEEVFFNALKNYEFELTHSGELTICKDLRLKTAGSP